MCEKYYQHVLVLLENADKTGAETDNTNELYFRLGVYQSLLCQLRLWLRYSSFGLQKFQHLFSDWESEMYARAINDLAIIYSNQGRYDEAVKKYAEALNICEKTMGREHPTYIFYLNNLATAYSISR